MGKESKEHHIYIYGDIFNDQSDYASSWGIVSLTDVKDQVEKNKDADHLIIHIHSRGGDVFEGFAIHDFLVATGKKITTRVEGECASIATIVFLAGSERQMTENSEFMIHNPTGAVWGDSEEIEKYLDFLVEQEEKILDFYVEKIGSDKDIVKDLMDEDKFITADEAKELGFVTEVIETMKAVAYLDTNKLKLKTMSLKDDIKEQNTVLKAVQDSLSFIKKKIVGDPEKEDNPKALDLTTADGKIMKIDSEDSDPHIGNTVMLGEDRPKDGEYLMGDKMKIQIKDGKISGIEPAEAKKEDDDPPKNDIEKLSNRVQVLTTDNSALADQNKLLTDSLKEITDTLTAIKDNIGSDYVPGDRQTQFVDKGKKSTEPMTLAAKAIQAEKDKEEEDKEKAKAKKE